jgi:xylulokinase
MLLLGIDLGTSSIKVSVVDGSTRKCIASAQFPETEVDIISPQTGWAEQSPDLWWEHVKQDILKCNATGLYDPKNIAAIGIAYQMHGLVLVDKDQHVLRNSIIWCDSRAIEIGEKAFNEIGQKRCLSHLLNSPGNFTASKLAWVKNNEPEIYERIDKILLPGDFIAMKLTGETTTTMSALSEGIFWDFKEQSLSKDVINYFDFDPSFFPKLQPVFAGHGTLKETVATRLSLTPGISVSYKAGDQPNNALSLNVLQPGEVAATAGTSGVIYGVSDKLEYDPESRINSFAHVNHEQNKNRIGVLLCINGAGIFNRWIKNMFGAQHTYETLNLEASHVEVGSNGLLTIPFGNGAERMLNNALVGAHFHNLDLNIHSLGHLVRSTQEGIAFAFRYGLDIMKENGIEPSIIRAGKANMFLSEVFTESFVNATGVAVELHPCDGSVGAALGAGIGAGMFAEKDLSSKPLKLIEPSQQDRYDELYDNWKTVLRVQLQKLNETSSLPQNITIN